MVYGYIRVSTDKQTVDNQRFEIERFCLKNSITSVRWIEETISGTLLPEKRLLGSLLAEAKTGDLIICSELSRLGRPAGSKSDRLKLTRHEAEIKSLIAEKVSKSAIARKFGVCRQTVISFLKNRQKPS
jgi:DNA invertase Pin-like site-specific DNA recombinase